MYSLLRLPNGHLWRRHSLSMVEDHLVINWCEVHCVARMNYRGTELFVRTQSNMKSAFGICHYRTIHATRFVSTSGKVKISSECLKSNALRIWGLCTFRQSYLLGGLCIEFRIDWSIESCKMPRYYCSRNQHIERFVSRFREILCQSHEIIVSLNIPSYQALQCPINNIRNIIISKGISFWKFDVLSKLRGKKARILRKKIEIWKRPSGQSIRVSPIFVSKTQ